MMSFNAVDQEHSPCSIIILHTQQISQPLSCRTLQQSHSPTEPTLQTQYHVTSFTSINKSVSEHHQFSSPEKAIVSTWTGAYSNTIKDSVISTLLPKFVQEDGTVHRTWRWIYWENV